MSAAASGAPVPAVPAPAPAALHPPPETPAPEAPAPETAVRATGLLADFNQRGVLDVADVNVALALGRMCGEADQSVLLALGLTVRSLRAGSVCLDLAGVTDELFEVDETEVDTSSLPWPELDGWTAALTASPLVRVQPEDGAVARPDDPVTAAAVAAVEELAPRPLRLLGQRLYLDRYFEHEESVRAQLERRRAMAPPTLDLDRVEALLDEMFDRTDLAPDEPNWQRIAAANSVLNRVSVIAGGPGTGKTTTVAKVLATLQALHGGTLRITLAAPTGKAAARLEEAVRAESARLPERLRAPLQGLAAATLHRVLGWRPESRTRFRHDRANPLPWDVLVVDEMSMVSLPMMARLLEATRSSTRVILVGDPDQLTSVEAGAVMADVSHARSNTAPVAEDDPRLIALRHVHADDRDEPATDPAELAPVVRGVVELTHTWRFGAEIGALARAVRDGDADTVLSLLQAGGPHVGWQPVDLATASPEVLPSLRETVQRTGAALERAARAGDAPAAVAALEEHRVLCAHRAGPFGVARWSRTVEEWLAEAIPGYGADGEWYVGRPLLVTANDPDIGLYNGDTGVVVATPTGLAAAFARGQDPRMHPLNHLDAVQSVHAMTVHKAQGSQFSEVTFVLPPTDSALLTRELLYTALTRARERVEIIGTEASLRRAVQRPAHRASGLRHRL